MSASGKTGVQAWVKRKQAFDVSLAVSLGGVVYLLEVGSFTTVIQFTHFSLNKAFSCECSMLNEDMDNLK